MKYIFQLGIILAVSYIADMIKYFTPSIPVPASIYGMLIMILLLTTKIIKLDWVKDTAHFMISIMPVFFIAPSVVLMESIPENISFIVPLLVISVVSTIVTMVSSGKVTELVSCAKHKSKNSVSDDDESGNEKKEESDEAAR